MRIPERNSGLTFSQNRLYHIESPYYLGPACGRVLWCDLPQVGGETVCILKTVRRIIYIERFVSQFIPLRWKGFFMAKRRGNPNWGKPEPIGPITPTVTEFEQVVREYKLSPDQYLRSTRLREWARRNKNSKYIPEPLLEAWGFEIESTL
jgi:hypothetical protein